MDEWEKVWYDEKKHKMIVEKIPVEYIYHQPKRITLIGALWYVILASLLLILVLPAFAYAQWYALGSVGTAHYYSIPNEVNNARFCDDGFTCSADNDGSSMQLGAGYRMGSWGGLNWSVEGAYARTGTMKLNSQFPADHNYDVQTARCLQECSPEHLYSFRGDWHYNGATVAVIGAYPVKQWSIYGKLGAALYHVDGSAAVGLQGQQPVIDMAIPGPDHARVQGWRGGVLYGVGMSYDGWRVKPFMEILQTVTTGQGYPGFANFVTAQAGVRIDL